MRLSEQLAWCVWAAALVCCLANVGVGADWPMYKSSPGRSAITSEQPAFPMRKLWVYALGQAPRPAWPEPGKELHRMDFDYAFQPALARGRVYFGSSADDTLRALDGATGKLLWRFTTDGPIRFAPAVFNGKVYVTSDDGRLYCLDAASGKQVWKFRGGPSDDRILGNGRMISRWPLRTGALVDRGKVYLTAGMWPTLGIYVYALDAETGKVRWRNDTSGNTFHELPHHAFAFNGVAPQGYLAASRDALFVPTGRSVPAAFDRKTGRLLYYRSSGKTTGGARIVVAGDRFYNPSNKKIKFTEAYVGEDQPSWEGMVAYDVATGAYKSRAPGYYILATGKTTYCAQRGAVRAIGKGRWSIGHSRVYSMALAGATLLIGGRDSITAVDSATGKRIWRARVDGQARGIAVANGRLVVATSKGRIVCFGRGGAAERPAVVRAETPAQEPGPPAVPQGAVRDIVRKTGVTRGYALVLGGADCRLATALALRTELHVICALPAESGLAAERAKLLASGLYGSRIVLHARERPSRLPYAPYFANLIVVAGDLRGLPAQEIFRVLRPCGGALYFLGSGRGAAQEFMKGVKTAAGEARVKGAVIVRGALPGAGEWRHQWADAARTGIGNETRLRLPLDILWFGGPGPDRMVDRHMGTSTPLSVSGRVFMTGQHCVLAFDAYNGHALWRREIKDLGRKFSMWYGANFVADDDSVYLAHQDGCLRLNQATGETMTRYSIPLRLASEADTARKQTATDGSLYVDVDLNRAWRVFGPFPKGEAPKLSAKQLAHIPERISVKGKVYAGAPLEPCRGVMDFTNLYGGYGLKPLPPGVKPGPYPRKGARRDSASVGKTAYAFAKLNCATRGMLVVGACVSRRRGAMQWYLDGKRMRLTYYRVYFSGFSPTKWVYTAAVSPGEHTLAVRVLANKHAWRLALDGGAKSVARLLPVPPEIRSMAWGFLASCGDLLIGSQVRPGMDRQAYWDSGEVRGYAPYRYSYTENTALFAVRKSDGAGRWVYRARDTISTNAIAIGDGKVFLLDATSGYDVNKARRRGKALTARKALVALNLADGRQVWRKDVQLPERYWHSLQLHYARGVVLIGPNAAFDGSNGRKLWQKENAKPGRRSPVRTAVYDDRIIAFPKVYGLRTGELRAIPDPLTGVNAPQRLIKSYGCGAITGCRDLLCFRSGVTGFFDLKANALANFGGVRPGCSVNMLPANGLLIMPEGSSGCACSYNFQTTVALAPSEQINDFWYVFPNTTAVGEVKRLRINLGANGDRLDAQGRPWFAFPRPKMKQARPVPAMLLTEKVGWFTRPPKRGAALTSKRSWLYNSGLRADNSVRIAIALGPRLSVAIPSCDKAPKINGEFDDACWKQADAVSFAFGSHLAPPETSLLACRDAKNLYFAYRREAGVVNGRPVPLVARHTAGRDRKFWRDDCFGVFFRNERYGLGAFMGVSCGGGRFDGWTIVRKNSPVSKYRLRGAWKYAAQRAVGEWRAEIAIPLKTLSRTLRGIAGLQINCMSQNLSGQGLRRICLTDPVLDFGRCQAFLPVTERQAPKPKPRAFTVRLHFAEHRDIKPGRRVFDISLQGNTVSRGFDLLKEAGGRNVPAVKEYRGVRAGDRLVIELTSRPGADGPGAAPILNGIEVLLEE